jgi:peptidoglycan/xylan/chitin deacetylase (PgdA/CDA1 family)
MEMSRRQFVAGATAAVIGMVEGRALGEEAKNTPAPDRDKALIAITLDLEMSRNFPTWDQTRWDYEKGNLDAATKKYSIEAARRVNERGGKIHFFVVGRVFEQENVDWLREIVRAGHPVGNHTYDHVNVKAQRPEDIQYRFRRAPWLMRGKTPREVIEDNIRLTDLALKARVGVPSRGFRTPGGFANGIEERPDLQRMLLDLGFRWVSSKYPAHPMTKAGEEPTKAVFDGIVKAQEAAQPFGYRSGLVEVPMSPISDITAFRTGRWKVEHFLKAIRRVVEWAIEHRAVFDFLGHPSCLLVTDPKFQALDLICDLVQAARGRAALADLDVIAGRGKISKVTPS